ncbi:MAG: carboxypeptidase regulatory-like protein [Candidatus Solibacter sp.]|nr:carboxypeptidase regulatory-like protein [Candidatus Solibacter sp.]
MRALRSSCGLLIAAAALAQTRSETASLQGSVTHSVTGAPVPRAHIVLRGAGPDAKSYGALATAEGKFSIEGIVPGTYQASAERAGFYMLTGPGGRATVDVTLRAGDKKDDLKFRLAPLGSISGRVVDADGEPVDGAAVTIEIGPGYSTIRDTTDDKGRFRLGDLRPGKYRVKAALPGVLPGSPPPEIRTDGTKEVRYAPTFFAGVTDYRSATRIELGTGAEVGGIEIRLMRVPMVRVSGRVVGVPPEQRGVELAFGQTTGARAMSGMKKDGTFEVWNVDPGKYFLTARWFNGNQRMQTAPVNVEIGESNLDNIELRVIPPSDISGQVVFEDEQARPPAQKPAKVELGTVDPGMFVDRAASDVGADATFQWNGVRAARYRVMLSWTSGYVKAVTLGSNQVVGNVLNLREGAGGAAVTVLVSSAFGSISGTVFEGDNPAAGARIALLRDDFVSLGDVTFTMTDGVGAYRIDKVRPGKYRIAAVEENDNGPRAGNLDDYEDILARVEVGARDKVTKDLKRHAAVR